MTDHAGPEPATDPVAMPSNLPCGSTVAAPECGDIGDDEDRHEPALLGAGPTRRVLRLVAAQHEGQPWPRTGLAELDELTGGLAPGTLTVIASRPAMGRSTLLTDVCRHVALRQRRPVWLCSLEESRDEVTTRVLSAESSVPLRHLRTGSVTAQEEQRLARAVVDIDAAPLRVSAPVALTFRELAVQARRLHEEQALRLLAVDGPDELLLAAGRPRTGEGAEILRALRRLARELQIPVVATAALDQSQAPGRRPAPADLRESDGVLRTADLVLLLHRADAYRQRIPLAGEAELTLAKHRHGLTGRLVIAHQGHRGRFVDIPDGPRFSAHGAEETIEDGVADTTPEGG